MKINHTCNSISSKAQYTKEIQLLNNKVVRFVTRKNGENNISYLETAVFNKSKDGKLFVENLVSTFSKPQGLDRAEKVRYAQEALKITDSFEGQSKELFEDTRLNTGILDAKHFIEELFKSIL